MMAKVQARLDEETQAALEQLRRGGLSTSDVIRKGIHMVAKEVRANKRIEIIGLGKYDSGVTDLSTNKMHLAGFGSHSRLKGKPVRKAKGR